MLTVHVSFALNNQITKIIFTQYIIIYLPLGLL